MRNVLGKVVLIASFVGLSACALEERDPADDSLDEPGIAEQSVEDAEQKLDLTREDMEMSRSQGDVPEPVDAASTAPLDQGADVTVKHATGCYGQTDRPH